MQDFVHQQYVGRLGYLEPLGQGPSTFYVRFLRGLIPFSHPGNKLPTM